MPRSSAYWDLQAEAKRRGLLSNNHGDRTGYQNDPVGYAHDVLGVEWWSKQQEIARALIKYKRVAVKASHSIGKSHLGGGLVNWFFDSFTPSITLTTAPTKDQVVDVLWKEVRRQRKDKSFLQPKAPRMERSESHYAVGYTAASGDAFQGRHEKNVLIVFDEAVGIPLEYWDAAEGMMTSADNCYWLAIFNPTDTASQAYLQTELSDKWHTISVSALEHPNIAAQLRGEPAPFPAAVSLGWVQDRIKEWCTPVEATDKKAIDIEFPPASGHWYRPGALFESRVLGRWASQATTAVWSEAMWNSCLVQQELTNANTEIGVDVARFGDDFTTFLVRRGGSALHHETHNGWSTSQTAGRIKQLCQQFAQDGETVKRIAVKVDDDGVGGGVTDQAAGYNFIAVNSGSHATEPEEYPNRRSELWFSVASRADDGRLDLSRLSQHSQQLIRRQVMAPTWKLDAQARRVVEPKSDTKKRIGRSPDDADALNLAFAMDTTPETYNYNYLQPKRNY